MAPENWYNTIVERIYTELVDTAIQYYPENKVFRTLAQPIDEGEKKLYTAYWVTIPCTVKNNWEKYRNFSKKFCISFWKNIALRKLLT